nr:retrovirus-related Pol polyprotein from transposon TNT 1-94 [Tanacetum cinerariifolium]
MAIMNLACEFDNACTAKDKLQKAYEECKDISLEQGVLIENVLKIESDKDYEMHNALQVSPGKIRTFLNYLCPLLIIDAVNLKGLYKGTNLVVVGMDGNNPIMPIAFGKCKRETGPFWSWWMSVLKECIGDNPNLLFISDRHPAIALVVHNEFPLAFHVKATGVNVGRDVSFDGARLGEYSQWRERFMNYLEEQTYGEAMINYIQNGDQPLPVIAQVSLVGNAQNAPPTLKDPKFWAVEEKKTRKIDHLWDALERQMRGSEYGEQDRKAVILYEYETFKAIEGEQLLDTYLRYLQVINDWKKCCYKKENRDVNDALGYKKKAVVVTSDPLALAAEKTNAFNRRKFYSKPTINNLRTSSNSQSANKKQEFVKSDDKKANEKKKDKSKVKCYNCKKEGHFTKDCKKSKVKDYNYYKTKMLLTKKDIDKQVLLAENQAWMESSSDSDQEINVNMVFMAQIEKVLLDSDGSSSSAEETIVEVSYYTSESESESEFETSEYYDNSTNHGLFVNNDDDQEIFHDAIESASENFIENHIDSQKDYDKMFDFFDDYNFFMFDDESVRISPVSKMLFRKKPHGYMNVRSKNCPDLSLDHRLGMFKDMTGNRALLTNFVEKFLGTVHFGNNDFAVIAGYGDVVISSMTRKKVYYVEGLGHNLFSVGQFCDKGLEIVQICLWIINSGCSKHMTGDDEVKRFYKPSLKPGVRFTKPTMRSKTPPPRRKENSHPRYKTPQPRRNQVPTPMIEQAKLKLDLVGKPVDHTDYRSMIGSLMYVTSSRPDIMFATCMCARYQDNPNEHHVSAVKSIFHYLKRTINLGLWYPKDFGFHLTAYLDANHAGCHLDRKSTYGSVQFLGDKLVCWSSKKQNCVSISKTKSEYVTFSSCCAQVLWMRTQLTDYGFFYDRVPIYCDSKSAIAISCNPVQHTRTKHIDVRYHFIKDNVEKGTIELYFVGTEYQLADL